MPPANRYTERKKEGCPTERKNNYAIAASQAKQLFLRYDQQALIGKLDLRCDENFLYVLFFGQNYRIARGTGDMERFDGSAWVDGNSFSEVMSILDLVCGSREDRHLGGKLLSMDTFGLQFHQNLNERENPTARYFDEHFPAFCAACLALGGENVSQGDAGFVFRIFEDLPLAVILWRGDDEFSAQLRYLWDENALQYIRYETMYYAVGYLNGLIRQQMQNG